MRVFVLTTGRCGSVTFATACQHIENFTSGHESRAPSAAEWLQYPDHHIEVDPLLSWYTGSLARHYDNSDTVWVYLHRDGEEIARSIAKRFARKSSMVRVIARAIVRPSRIPDDWETQLQVGRIAVEAMTDNILQFLDGREFIEASLPDLRPGFDEMWERIGATGNREAAHRVLQTVHNASRS